MGLLNWLFDDDTLHVRELKQGDHTSGGRVFKMWGSVNRDVARELAKAYCEATTGPVAKRLTKWRRIECWEKSDGTALFVSVVYGAADPPTEYPPHPFGDGAVFVAVE